MSIDQAHTSPKWRRSTFGRFARVFNGSDYTTVEVDSGGYPVYGSGGEFRRASDYLFEGESVLFGRKGTIDRPLYVNGRFWTVDTMFYTDIDTRTLLPRFAYYWATTLPYGEWATDTALPSMTSTAIKAAPIVVPPMVEQRAIADFLDRETAQIDAFIAKNEELIALLTERRATVIRNATTTGIGYHDDLVDSGDEQVGSIPTRWRMLRLSFLFGSTASGTTPASEQILDADHADVPWVTTGELREAQITGTLRGVSAEILATTPALRLHPEGALLIAMYGATIGRTAILRVPAASNQAVCALSRPTGCDVEYVELALQASRERLRLKAVGGGQPNINQETVRAFRIPVPPLEEQRAIVAYVKEQTAHINAAMANAMRCADLARERRAALISAAVTGKIDVGVSA